MKHNHIHYSTSFKHVKKATQGVFSSPLHKNNITSSCLREFVPNLLTTSKGSSQTMFGFFLFHFVLVFFLHLESRSLLLFLLSSKKKKNQSDLLKAHHYSGRVSIHQISMCSPESPRPLAAEPKSH